jgi:hypothetical protein
MEAAMNDPDTPQARGDAAAVTSAGGPSTGRSGLDQRRILGAAVQFIDENGLRMLTMQRLGAYLGVEAMALYRYIPGREALLDGVVETVVDELFGDPDVHLEAMPAGSTTCSDWPTACAGSPWPTPKCSPWSPPGLPPRRGYDHRCAACAGSNRCSR